MDVIQIIKQFRNDAGSFYDFEAIRQGYIVSKDRDGKTKSFPLLTVSAVILELPALRSRVYSIEEISNLMAKKKKSAKDSPEKIGISVVGENTKNTRDTIYKPNISGNYHKKDNHDLPLTH